MIRFMLKSLPRRAGRAALVMSAVMAPAVPAYAQYIGAAPPPPAAPLPGTVESPGAALARNVRLIALNPKNFQALVAAGHAALATGDTQAAIGFYGRAEDISPTAWQPQAGKGAAMVAMGEPEQALSYFARAQQYGATQMLIAVDRGLAFDLMGDQAKAQSDYRAALAGADGDEARRRLALSLAISRNIKAAGETIEPLLLRRDPEAVRTNAFILALAGDREGARRTIDAAMPGAGLRFEPYFKMLPVLRPEEKAAAVHLGIFPKDAAQRYASAEPVPISPVVSIGNSAPQRQAALAQKQARKETSKAPVKVAQAPRRATEEAAMPSTYMAMVRPSLDPSRYASTRRPKTQSSDTKPTQAADNDPEPRPADRLGDIAELLAETPDQQQPIQASAGEPVTEVAEAAPPEPAFVFDAPAVSRPKVEIASTRLSKPKVEAARPSKADIDAKKKADKLAADKKAKAEADRKAKAEASKLGVAGTNWVQLAGGANQDRMAAEYKRIAAKAGSALKSRAGYVTEGKDYFRLLVGPFANADDAQDFVTKLDKAGVDSFRWTRNPAQIRIEKLKS
jgi:tetratricopeptide (TPR) repeat protein